MSYVVFPLDVYAVTFPLDVDDLKYLAGEAIDLRGETFAYKRNEDETACSYWQKDRCGCIIGTILWLAGVSQEELKAADQEFYLAIRNSPLSKYFTPAALEYAEALQVQQDQGGTWGESVEWVFRKYDSSK